MTHRKRPVLSSRVFVVAVVFCAHTFERNILSRPLLVRTANPEASIFHDFLLHGTKLKTHVTSPAYCCDNSHGKNHPIRLLRLSR